MLSPYRIPANNTKKIGQNLSNTNLVDHSRREHDLKRPQRTSIYFAKADTNTEFTSSKQTSNKRNKKILKGGFMRENIEINEDYLDEILQKK